MQVSLKDILTALSGPALCIGSDDRIAVLNSDAEALFGARSLGRGYGVVIRHPELLRAITRARQTRGTAEARVTMTRPGQSDTIYDARVSSIETDDGTGLLLLFHDLTENEAGDRRRQDFVANVSHELKSPLTAIRGFLDTLAGPARDDDTMRARFMDLMQAEVLRMGRLVDDLLALSRVEAKEARRPTDLVALGPLLDDVVALHAPLARDAGIAIEAGDWSALDPIRGDADQLRQVLANLLGNAIAHSRARRITLDIEPRDRDPVLRARALVISVEDDGQGIETHHLPRLTERFYRADDHRARRGPGGTGLGLSIVKHVLARHRGRLAIRSQPGQGARFEAILPLGSPDTNL